MRAEAKCGVLEVVGAKCVRVVLESARVARVPHPRAQFGVLRGTITRASGNSRVVRDSRRAKLFEFRFIDLRFGSALRDRISAGNMNR